MIDKELLELAAKAAGMTEKWTKDGIYVREQFCEVPWNPLTDDGDALRLAVKLCIDVWYDDDFHEVGTTFMVGEVGYNTEESWRNGDKLEATHRAITRAAAEIGKAMKS